MRKFFLGLIVGALIFSIIPVYAAIEEYICYKADYKVVVRGIVYSDPELPILNYKGNTYVPMRGILEAAGLSVNWNAELGQAEVDDLKNNNEFVEKSNKLEIETGECKMETSILDENYLYDSEKYNYLIMEDEIYIGAKYLKNVGYIEDTEEWLFPIWGGRNSFV